MILSNETYKISITKDDAYPLRSIEIRTYNHKFNPCGYNENNFHAAFVIRAKTTSNEVCITLIGSFYSNADHCAVLDGSNLTILMDDEIVLFDLKTVSITAHKTIGDETYFSIYPISGGYLIHGELEILRLDNKYERVWSFYGSDIWVTQDGTHEAFMIANDQIMLEDWNGVKYALDMDGRLIWDTYNK